MAILERAAERLALMQRTRSVAIVGMSANPARGQPLRGDLPDGKTDWTLWYVNPTRDRSVRPTGVPDRSPTCRTSPTSSTCSVDGTTLPAIVEEAIDVRRVAPSGSSSGLTHDEAAATRQPMPDSTSCRIAASRSSTLASAAGCTPPASSPA